MIRAVLFDLDGTLVQTERLKALSYARAATELSRNGVDEARVIDAFKVVVGRTREEVALSILERLNLEQDARARTAEFGVKAPWEVLAQIRLGIYEDMLANPALLRDHRLPHVITLLRRARREYKTGLASMSYRDQVGSVVHAIELDGCFDVIASRDDVRRGKPDPEIYHLVAGRLGVPSGECLVIEDSATGVESAMAAGMWCIAATSEFTREGVWAGRLDRRWIVDDPTLLDSAFTQMLSLRSGETLKGGV